MWVSRNPACDPVHRECSRFDLVQFLSHDKKVVLSSLAWIHYNVLDFYKYVISLQDVEKAGWNMTIIITFMIQDKSRGQRPGYSISICIALYISHVDRGQGIVCLYLMTYTSLTRTETRVWYINTPVTWTEIRVWYINIYSSIHLSRGQRSRYSTMYIYNNCIIIKLLSFFRSIQCFSYRRSTIYAKPLLHA
jgi:hypothetical protein